jgi:hypothetical protein
MNKMETEWGTMSAQRTIVLQAIADRLDRFFGNGGLVATGVLRKVVCGQYNPVEAARPMATVEDLGTEKTGSRNSCTEKSEKLRWKITLDLAANFARPAEVQSWLRTLSAIKMSLQNFCPPAGVLRADVTDDSPAEVLLTDGTTWQAWVIQGETEYVVSYCDLLADEATFLAAAKQVMEN